MSVRLSVFFFFFFRFFFSRLNAPQRNGIRDQSLFKSEGVVGVEEKMRGPQYIFSRTWGALKGQKGGLRGS